MFAKTKMSYGVNEVLLASVLGSVVFSIFAAQPLTIVGVTGALPKSDVDKTEISVFGFPLTSSSGMRVQMLNDPRSNYCVQLYCI